MKSSNQNKHRSVTSKSKLRWEIIASACKQKGLTLNNKNSVSIRRFSSFGLFDRKEINCNEQLNQSEINQTEDQNNDSKWYYFSLDYKEIKFKVKLKLASNKIPFKEIFYSSDNTGTFIWPAEEVLSYFCLKNNFLFDTLNCVELGCGSALGGITVAIASKAKYVLLTDANLKIIENVKQIINENQNLFGQTKVECKKLKWHLMNEADQDKIDDNLKNKFDIILCSDLLYYEKSHLALIETIYNLLNTNGICIIMAPLRQNTFQEFMKLSFNYFSNVKIHIIYDDVVFQLNRKFQTELNNVYEMNLHYPIMAILSNKI